jgi:hypothetical protein
VDAEWDHWERVGEIPPTGSPLPPAEFAASPAQLHNVGYLEANADAAVKGLELARLSQAPRLAQGTLEGVERAVDRLRREYSSIPPGGPHAARRTAPAAPQRAAGRAAHPRAAS